MNKRIALELLKRDILDLLIRAEEIKEAEAIEPAPEKEGDTKEEVPSETELTEEWTEEVLEDRIEEIPLTEKPIEEVLENYIEQAVLNTEKKLKEQISLNDWGNKLNEITRDAHLSALKEGKKGKISPPDLAQLSNVGFELHAPAVSDFAKRIPELTPPQILARTSLYGENAKATYHQGVHSWHKENGYIQAKRELGVNDRHCADCVALESDWSAIENVTPPGTDCRCGGRCHCVIYYR